MIRKLQIKFVAMCMLLVTAVLAVVFLAVYFSAKQNIEVISHQVLQRVIQEEDTQGELPNFGRDPGREDVLLPYFTVNVRYTEENGSRLASATVTGGTYSNHVPGQRPGRGRRLPEGGTGLSWRRDTIADI